MKKTLEEQLEPIETLKRFEEMMELIRRYPIKSDIFKLPKTEYQAEDQIIYYR